MLHLFLSRITAYIPTMPLVARLGLLLSDNADRVPMGTQQMLSTLPHSLNVVFASEIPLSLHSHGTRLASPDHHVGHR